MEQTPERSVPAAAGRRHAGGGAPGRAARMWPRTSWIFSFSSAAVVRRAGAASGWACPAPASWATALPCSGAALPKGEMKPFYSIQVRARQQDRPQARRPGDHRHPASASPLPRCGSSPNMPAPRKWEQAEMRTEPGGSAYQFLIAGVPESLEYYVEAGGVRSATYKLNVVDLPAVKNIRVTYHFPSWTGMKDAVEDPGGDLRAVEGTNAEVAIQTDRPLSTGALLLDDGTKIPLRSGADGHAGGQRAHPEGRPVSRGRGGRRRRRPPERRLFHRGPEGPAARSQDHPPGPRFPRLAHRRSHRRGGSQGRFRPEGRRRCTTP